MTTTLLRIALSLLAVWLALSGGGCQSGGTKPTDAEVAELETTAAPQREEGYWVSHAVPRLTTIARDTTWSVVRRDDYDTIVLRERRTRPDGTTGQLTWLISCASPPAIDSAIALDGTQAHGWLIEEGSGQRTYATGLTGEVVVHERAAERLVASVNVSMAPSAREAVREDDDAGVTLQADVDLPRRRVHVPASDMQIQTYPGSR